MPIVSDKVLLRLAGNVSMRDGYTTDVGPGPQTGKDYSNRNYWGFRASLVLRPTDDIENVTIVSSLYRDEHGPGVVLGGINPAGALVQTVGLATAQAYLAAQTARGPRLTSNGPSGIDKEWDYGVTNITHWDVRRKFRDQKHRGLSGRQELRLSGRFRRYAVPDPGCPAA